MEGYARVPETGITRKMNGEFEFVDLLGVDWDRFQEFSLKFRRTDGYIWEDCLRLDEYWKGNNEKSGRRVWERVMFISSLKFGYMGISKYRLCLDEYIWKKNDHFLTEISDTRRSDGCMSCWS